MPVLAAARASRFGLTSTELGLVGAVVAVVAWEAMLWAGPLHGYAGGVSLQDSLPPAALMAAALAFAARRPEDLRLGVVLGLVAGMAIGFLAVHHLIGGPHDTESAVLYERYGRQLLDTRRLPVAEYPPLALLALGVATAIGPPSVILPLLILPLWLLGLRSLGRLGPWGPWAIAATTLWAGVLPFWELRFDALAISLLALGLAAAWRDRWVAVGVLLALGGCVKWYPVLTLVVLAAGLIRARDLRRVGQLGIVGLATIVAVTVPLAIVGPTDALVHPYTFQSGRGIAGQSLPYAVLHLVGVAHTDDFPWETARYASGWLDVAIAVQVVAVGALLVLAWLRPRRAWALAALAPAVALLTNRIYSSQFTLVVLAAAGALLAVGRPSRRGTLVVVASAGLASVAGYGIYPGGADPWFRLSVVSLASLVALLGSAWAALPPAAKAEERDRPIL